MLVVQIICVVALLAYLALLVVVGRRARQREARAFLQYLISMLIWQISITGAVFSTDPTAALAWYGLIVWTSGLGLFYAIFVREYLGIKKHRGFIWIGMVILIVLLIWGLAGSPRLYSGIHQDPRIAYWLPEIDIGIYAIGLFNWTYILYGAYQLVKYYQKTSSALMRNRIKYLLTGIILVLLGTLINLTDALKVYPIDMVANVVNAALIAYAILRFQLLDINLVIRKGLVYSIPTVIIGTGYLLAVYLTVNLFHFVAGYEILLISLVVAAIVALLLQPLRDRTQLWVDKFFFREKYDTNLMLQRLSQRASSVLDIDILARMILDEIDDTIHITKSAIFLKETEGYSLVVQRGTDSDTNIILREDSPIVQRLSQKTDILSRHTLDVSPQFKGLWGQERRDLVSMEAELLIPLTVREELIGILMLGPKRSEGSYTDDDQLTLMTLANQTAIAVQNAWLYQTAIEEKERTEIILHQAFAGIMVVDQDLRITSVNPGAEEITQLTAQELLGQRFSDVFDAYLWNKRSSLHKAIMTMEPVAPTETVLMGKGASRDVLLGVTPLYDGFLLNFTDITELKEVERLKSNIVANVSHELRTPLASIKGYTELLINEYEGQDRHLRHEFLSIINGETDRLTRFITDLLDLSRLESGQVDPHKEYLFLDRVINESLRMLTPQSSKAGVEIHVDSPEGIPSILANRNLMTSVIRNLVSNAIKYSQSGGRVDVIVRQQGESLVLNIVDQGLGIPSDDLPYLFTKFYRAGSAQGSGIGGTGLGLALAKEAVEAHHGTISVVSEAAVGTHFTVTLPLQGEELTPVDDGYAVPQPPGGLPL